MISGFSYVRNGLKYGYPFIESIQSILPVCDEFVIALGDSTDGTREAIEQINGDKKIRIIDTVWDEQLRIGGKIFAQQSNIALKACKGDWLFHIQADEVVHEKDLDDIKKAIAYADKKPAIEGLLFDFLNFYGSYDYLNGTRYQHKKEIRIFRNNLNVFSYKDSQGFRRYKNYADYEAGSKGEKLKVKYIHIPVYHYSYVRPPEQMNEKSKYFEKFWHNDNYIKQKYSEQKKFDYYNNIERVVKFNGSHPQIMLPRIEASPSNFDPKLIKKQMKLKDKILTWVEDRIHYRIGENKNYIIIE